jgi:hypothetical protein
MNNNINFDSTDWNSIADTIDKINKTGEMQIGTTFDGETILFDVYCDKDGNDQLMTEVFQKNGWIRLKIYNPREYIVEELYHRW